MLVRAFIASCLVCLSLMADVVNSDLLNIHSQIYPQIPFFKAQNRQLDTIIIAALYQNAISKRRAEEFKNSVEEKYGKNIRGRKLIISPMPCEEALKIRSDIEGVYIVDCDKNVLKELSGIMTFAAKRSDFDENYAMFYIDITSHTKILINKKVLLSSGFMFTPEFLKITTVVKND